MNGKQIKRKTKVVSISLDPEVLVLVDKLRKEDSQDRSSFINSIVKKQALWQEFKKLQEYGREKAKKFKITSEEDVYRIMGDA
ncbi:hypothetical protein A3D84_02530 [Candidatus Woesebacteria bacterium RIFCSPHIGHO2_02_FULL_42_20]|uniref:Ribbon-helix-helix protein CopG domain-containing protein n=1 Tax=Candidatus Woesebacteria bacterium RIFCSPHIGHO2_12_FULL_41_24 TaxID=1802510 RepID=A0A1F8APK8_9BACT|nr:MAG: hypothetical protein A2W15_02725 [Candidatus Woesebacteria bacterium RBG_16_41_13]OGM29221.1 MAG: hypothetical protein A2873_03075 [Candidatus Woesebacteria bacterium RIFCSPHIGHO2_01_FULL_42_80]OGM34719.1 MAG: hypothetical protein A3D84_02530 [Candidatus Woesebacteria bacterium RIFCSPHIGHO2_02_FULL_42_20]OGM53692.1 MAG: hypothetical protein A3E44_02310 [Candidatus Woesebacteria bacterium RIFCSPHIGHO2_12_FULL_41_24]OGM67018.1 MAG: hypothetical protein A2969_05725 [Candidatus Woesebacteri